MKWDVSGPTTIPISGLTIILRTNSLSMDKSLGKDPDLKEANKATIEDLENHFVRKV